MWKLPPAVLILAIPLIVQANFQASAPERICVPDDKNPYTGYRWSINHAVCIPGVISMRTWYTPNPPYAKGKAVWYGPNVMEGTARYRNLSLEGFKDGVALMSPADIGRTVWLRRPGETWEGPFLVVDTAARQDMWPVIMHRKEIVEVGFQTAAKWGMVTAPRLEDGTYVMPYSVTHWQLEDVEVLKMDSVPDWISIHEPLDYVEWFESFAQFVNPRDIWRPYALPPEHEKFPGWMWRGTDPYVAMNAYDDWYEFLWPGDERFDFQFGPPEPQTDRCVYLIDDCPDHWKWLLE